MARIRKFSAYRRLERPYTRKSKYRKKSYVRATPNSKIVRYVMGNLKSEFPESIDLISKDNIQIRHNAIESARLICNRRLESTVGKLNYKFIIRMYPHHILRENPLASGAGADRMSTGMKSSFGKPIGIAAQVKKGKVLMTIETSKTHLPLVKKALKLAAYKLPCSCSVTMNESKK